MSAEQIKNIAIEIKQSYSKRQKVSSDYQDLKYKYNLLKETLLELKQDNRT